MEVYKTPESSVVNDKCRKFEPVKGLLFGICVSIFVVTIVSSIVSVIVAMIGGINLTSPDVVAKLSGYLPLLLIDLFVTAAILYFAGRITGKHTPGRELKYGIYLAGITIVIYVPLFYSMDIFSTYPVWYTGLSLVIPAIAIFVGARSTIQT